MPPNVTRLFPPLSLNETLDGLGSLTDPEFDKFLAETQTVAAFDNSLEDLKLSRTRSEKTQGSSAMFWAR